MLENPTTTHALGLHPQKGSLLGATLSYSKKQPTLESLFEFPFSTTNADNVKPLYINTNDQRKLINLERRYMVVTDLPAQEVLIRPTEIKLKKEKDIDAALAFQAEPLLPYPIENAILDRIMLGKTPEGTQLAIVSTRKDYLEENLKKWADLSIDPEVVTTTQASLAEFANFFVSSSEPLFILHIGLASTICVLTNGGKLLTAQGINLGLNHLASALAKDKNEEDAFALQQLTEINFQLPIDENAPHFAEAFSTLRQEITKTFYALSKAIKGKNVESILVTGETGNLHGFTNHLCQNLNKTLLYPEETPTFKAQSAELQKYAIPIGSALSVLPKPQNPLNFRQQEFAYPKPWKRLKKPLALYLALCAFIATSLFLAGQAYLAFRESQVKTQYLDLLHIMNKPHTFFEKEYFAKFPDDPPRNEEEIVPVSELSKDNILNRLHFIEKEIKATPQSYPLLPNVPLVSDVLAWISTHPNFLGRKNEGESQALQLESFNYTMVKRPEQTKKQEKYQVKVEIEFSSPNPKMAREFHDALIAPNEIVDSKAEIKWTSNRDKYRASFFLKDKTVYPKP